MKNPVVTLVTPSYNQSSFILKTIESVVSQDYSDVEYVVVNDGSTDNTDEIIKSIPNPSFEYIFQKNKGQSATLNEQWSRSNAKYITYLSSDDILYPSAISKAVAVMEANEDVVCVFPDGNVIDEAGRIIKRSIGRPFDLEELVVRQECYIGVGAVFRRSGFEKVGGWRTDFRLTPDWEFWIRLAAVGRFHFIPEALGAYRLHTNSYSVKETSHERSLEYITVLDDYFSGKVPDDMAAKKSEAYANANIIIARNAFRRGDASLGLRHLRIARKLHPRSVNLALILRLVRNVVSKPIRLAIFKLRTFARGA